MVIVFFLISSFPYSIFLWQMLGWRVSRQLYDDYALSSPLKKENATKNFSPPKKKNKKTTSLFFFFFVASWCIQTQT